MTLRASAPGKVVILGEYAVLAGAPALVAAIDRRVRVTLRAAAAGVCTIRAPGFAPGDGCFTLHASGPRWRHGDAAAFRLARHVIQALLDGGDMSPDRAAFDLTLDSSALLAHRGARRHKLGLGSSAALCVALCQALRYHGASPAAPDPGLALERLIQIHCELQRGRGSGVDVAASLHGGMLEFCRVPAPHGKAARLPAELAYVFVWTGRAAATGDFLARIDAWQRADPQAAGRLMAGLAEIARSGAAAARASDGDAFLASLTAYGEALEALGSASGTNILSAPHRRLRVLAGRHGVAYKPCGAGGGDIGVGMSADPDALDRFRGSLAAERFEPLSLNIDPRGVAVRAGD